MIRFSLFFVAFTSLLTHAVATAAPAYSDWAVPSGIYPSLHRQFDDVCGDTFCEGEFGNLTSMGINCAIDANDVIKACIWTFSGSTVDIDPTTGDFITNAKSFTCDLSLHGPRAQVEAFLLQVASKSEFFGEGLRQIVIPGGDKTLFEVLSDCI